MSVISYLKLTRIHRPTGVWLLYLPCLFGITLQVKLSDLELTIIIKTVLLFLLGSVLMRSAGCVINDLFDRKFDKNVSRTKNRPLVSGEASVCGALFMLFILLSVSLVVLLQFNLITVISGFMILSLVILYPLMKRVTFYPQLFLGITFNFGSIMTCLALRDGINLQSVILYLACIIWTMIYDTIYGFQDLEDDIKIGVKSAAIKFKDNPRFILTILNLLMLVSFVSLGVVSSLDSTFFLGILTASLFLDYKLKRCDLSNPAICLKLFKQNIWVGLIILIAISFG